MWSLFVEYAGEKIYDLYEWCKDNYQKSSFVRAAVDSFLVLIGIAMVDAATRFQVAIQPLYIAPVWVAAQRGGRNAGLLAVVTTTLMMTTLEAAIGRVGGFGIGLNLTVRLVVMYGLMRLIDSLEHRLQFFSRLATRDSLTGCANRVAFEGYIQAALKRAGDSRDPLCLAMIDCDKFKQLNDHYGHGFGDHVLSQLGRLLRRSALPKGIAARMGGDEFVCVFPNKNAEETAELLERLQCRFAAALDLGEFSATFSFGVAEFGIDRKDVGTLTELADQDMYRRKHLRAAANYAICEPRAVKLSA